MAIGTLFLRDTVYPKKYAHGFCFAVLCCGYTLTDFPISIRLTSLALWQSNDCPSASKATLMNMDKYFMWIHYERLHNHNKAKHNKTVCIFLGIYCIWWMGQYQSQPLATWIYDIPNFAELFSYSKEPCVWYQHMPLYNTFCVFLYINIYFHIAILLFVDGIFLYYGLGSPHGKFPWSFMFFI